MGSGGGVATRLGGVAQPASATMIAMAATHRRVTLAPPLLIDRTPLAPMSVVGPDPMGNNSFARGHCGLSGIGGHRQQTRASYAIEVRAGMTSYGRRRRRDPVKAHLCLLVVAGALSAALAGCARGPLPPVLPEVETGAPSFAPSFEAYTPAPFRW